MPPNVFAAFGKYANVFLPFCNFCNSFVPSGSFFHLMFSVRGGKVKTSEFIFVIRLAPKFNKSFKVIIN